MPAVLDRLGGGPEELQQLLDASFGQALAEEQAPRDGVGADDVALLVSLVPVRQEHGQLDERVDPSIQLGAVEVLDAQDAFGDLGAREPLVDVALAERADDRFGVPQHRRVVDHGAAVGRDRGRHRAEPARGTGAPMALPDEVELVLFHRQDPTQGV